MKRMLYIPLISHWSLEGNEGFEEFFAFSDELRKRGEKVFWYVVMPSWVTDGLRGHDRMQYVYVDNTRDLNMNDVVGFPAFELAKYFSRRGGKFIIDGVVSGCVRFSAYVSRLLSDPSRDSFVPLFLRDLGNGIEEMVRDKLDDSEWLQLAVNYVLTHTGVVSDLERRTLSSLMVSKLNPVIARRFSERSFVWPIGYDLEAVDHNVEVAMGEMIPDRYSLFCGGNFDNGRAKRFELEAARKLYALTSCKVVVVSQSPLYKLERVLPSGNDRSFISGIGMSAKGETYKRSLSRSHLFISALNGKDASMWEEELERFLYGQIGIFPNLLWVTERIGSDYPFLYNAGEMEEAILLAEWIVHNYDDASRSIEGVVSRIRRIHNIGSVVDVAWSFMNSAMDENYRITQCKEDHGKRSLFSTVYKVAIGLGDEFSLDVFLDVMEEHLSWLKPWGRKGSLKELGEIPQAVPTLYDIREMLDNLGWVDTCETSDIVVRRERLPLDEVQIERLDRL